MRYHTTWGMPPLLLLVAMIMVMLMLHGCGGGGGGGSGSGGGPQGHLVTIGTVQFNTATSTNFNGSGFYFNLLATQTWTIETPVGSTPTPDGGISYTTDTLTLAGQDSLPVVVVQLTPTPAFFMALAVGTDGALYAVTAPAMTGASLTAIGQPMVVIPSNANLTVGYTSSSAIALVGGNMDAYNAATPFTLTVLSTSETSPHGFLNCLHVQLSNGNPDPSKFETFNVWYQAEEGAVDEIMSTGTGSSTFITDEEFRAGIAFPG